MKSIINFRSIATACSITTFGLLGWITVAPSGFAGTPLVVGVTLSLLVAALKLGVSRPVDYWVASNRSQASRLIVMIVASVIIHFTLSAGLILSNAYTWQAGLVITLIVWTGVPVTCLRFGWVDWPRRLATPHKREFLIVAAASLVIAFVLGLLASTPTEAPSSVQNLANLAFSSSVLLVSATMEEIVFRVLLLTAIVEVTKSRMQALIFSSLIFVLCHIPLTLAYPVVMGDLNMLSEAATSFWPEVVVLTCLAFLFGALWIRTGSIALVAVVHAMLNLGDVVATGLEGLVSF